MRAGNKRTLPLLSGALAVVVATCMLAALGGQNRQTDYYDIQMEAAQRLEGYFLAIRGYKEELGIPMAEEDIHQTGMIGERFTGITTTVGAIEAKRTTAWPDMGALCVRLLYEAGVRPGDTVGAGFSGSFPGMNLAVVAACESMGVKLVCISSVGASTYGATNPELTFPEMMWRLEQDGLVETCSAAVTIGGDDDIGANMMDQELVGQIRGRLLDEGLPLVEEPDFQRNLAWRESLYQEQGPIDRFVAVGGNLTSMGLGESGITLGQGVLNPARTPVLDENSGLVQRYLAQGLPVINLLNIRKLVTDYGLPFDPVDWPPIGESAVYSTSYYPRAWLLLGLAGAGAILLLCGWLRHRPAQSIQTGGKNGGESVEDPDDR